MFVSTSIYYHCLETGLNKKTRGQIRDFVVTPTALSQHVLRQQHTGLWQYWDGLSPKLSFISPQNYPFANPVTESESKSRKT